MDEFVTYVLYSEKFDRIYIGFTSSLIQRFYSHNLYSKKGHTTKFRPWIVVLVEYHESKKEAIMRERSLKSGQGRTYIRNKVLSFYKE